MLILRIFIRRFSVILHRTAAVCNSQDNSNFYSGTWAVEDASPYMLTQASGLIVGAGVLDGPCWMRSEAGRSGGNKPPSYKRPETLS